MTRHHKGGKKKGNAPKKPSLTHFLCIPLVTSISRPQLEASIGKFKDDVCAAASAGAIKEQPALEGDTGPESNISSTDDPGTDVKSIDTSATRSSDETEEITTPPAQAPLIAEKAVRPVGALHLTLGVMSLDGDKLTQATELLNNLDLEALVRESTKATGTETDQAGTAPTEQLDQPLAVTPVLEEPLNISLRSLHPMQSPHKTSILYIFPSDPTDRLQPLCSALRTRFSEAELLVPDTRPLKLHATVVNTIYAKGKRKPKSNKGQKKDSEAKSEGTETTGGKVERDPAVTEAYEGQDKEPEAEPEEKATDQQEPAKQLTANDSGSGHGPSANAPLRFDAREILSRYKDHVWAENFRIDRVAICEMGAKKVMDDAGNVIKEEYKEIAVRRLPGC